jgi:transketolase
MQGNREEAGTAVEGMATIDTRAVRRLILRHSRRANVGHIGSCLCVVEILAALYGNVLRSSPHREAGRDRFVLSKGHAALALYATLAVKGWLPESDLDSFCGENSLYAVHPDAAVSGVDFSTGSLGHGLGIAAGAALAARIQGSERRAYCLISDAECNEGSVWEAAMFASHQRLGNLQAILDSNGQQALGLTRDVIDMPDMAGRWRAFGWETEEVDGHSVAALTNSLSRPSAPVGPPRLILAHTTFGKGVGFMERGEALSQPHLATQPINWHYLPMSDLEFEIAAKELDRA